MILDDSKIKSVKADIAKQEITISFVVDMTDENLTISKELSVYADKDLGSVDITITPKQMALLDVFGKDDEDKPLEDNPIS